MKPVFNIVNRSVRPASPPTLVRIPKSSPLSTLILGSVVPLKLSIPDVEAFPTTSSLAVGSVVPMARLPLVSRRIRSIREPEDFTIKFMLPLVPAPKLEA